MGKYISNKDAGKWFEENCATDHGDGKGKSITTAEAANAHMDHYHVDNADEEPLSRKSGGFAEPHCQTDGPDDNAEDSPNSVHDMEKDE